MFITHIFNANFKAKKRALAASLLAMSTGSQILMGYPQIVCLSLVAEGFFIVYLLISKKTFKTVFYVAWLKIIGLLLGAIQLYPTWESLQSSLRKVPTDTFLYSGSLHPWNLMQLISPYFFTDRIYVANIAGNVHECGLYSGIVASFSVFYVLVFRKCFFSKKSLATACVLLFTFTLILALGHYGYLYRLQIQLPFFNSFRVPARYILIVHLVMAMCSCLMMHDIIHARTKLKLKALWFPLIMLTVFIVGYSLRGKNTNWGFGATTVNEHGFLLLGLGIGLGACVLIYFAHKDRALPLILLALFVAADQGYYGLSYVFSNTSAATTPIEKFDANLAFPPKDNNRLLCKLYHGNVYSMYGYRITSGYVGLFPKKLMDNTSPKWHQAAGVSWVLRAPSKKIKQPHWSRAALPPCPHYYLVTDSIKSGDVKRDINRINPLKQALVEKELNINNDKILGKIKTLEQHPSLLSLELTCPDKQLLVFSESYHPGWQVRINGKEVETLKVNGDFMGCLTQKGQQTVEFKFNSPAFNKGKIISLTALFLLMMNYIFMVKTNKQS